MSEQKLRIGITQGDPNGIGWEVILKTFADMRMTELCTPVIYGSPQAAAFYRKCVEDSEELTLNPTSRPTRLAAAASTWSPAAT